MYTIIQALRELKEDYNENDFVFWFFLGNGWVYKVEKRPLHYTDETWARLIQGKIKFRFWINENFLYIKTTNNTWYKVTTNGKELEAREITVDALEPSFVNAIKKFENEFLYYASHDEWWLNSRRNLDLSPVYRDGHEVREYRKYPAVDSRFNGRVEFYNLLLNEGDIITGQRLTVPETI